MQSLTRLFSDNAAAVHPHVMEAMARANHVQTSYDGDALSLSLDGAFSALFETPCEVVWVATGTAANSTFCMTRCVLMGPWAWGDVTRSIRRPPLRSIAAARR